MANDIKLGDYKPLDANLKPVKVDEVVSALELSSVGNGARITGGLEVTADLLGSNAKPINGNPIITNYLTVPIATTIGLNIKGSFGTDTTEGEGINFLQSDKTIALFSGHHNSTFFYIYGNIGATTDNYLHIKVEDDGVSTIVTNDSDGEVGHLVLQPDGDLNLYPKTGTVKIADIDATSDFFQVAVSSAGATTLSTVDSSASAANLTLDVDGAIVLDSATGNFILYANGDTDDLCRITVEGNGATTIATVDSDGSAGHLTLDPNGDLLVSGADVKIDATNRLFFDGGGDTYIYEESADQLNVEVGGDRLLQLNENGTDGNNAWFRASCAGFTQIEPTFDATDTEIDFRQSNKQKLTLTADITNVHFQFPAMSGSFLCVFLQDGTGGWDVSNWKTKDQAGNAGAGNSGVVLWSHAAAPSLTETASKADIITIYWDADNELAYGMVGENF